MLFEEYKKLRYRLKKGKELLHKEYYTAQGGKGRRDNEILKIVTLWFKMSNEVYDYEIEHGIYPKGSDWHGIEEYEKLAEK